MSVMRVLVMIVLAILAGGLGLCALTAAAFSIQSPMLLLVAVPVGALCWGCVVLIKSLNKPSTPEPAAVEPPKPPADA